MAFAQRSSLLRIVRATAVFLVFAVLLEFLVFFFSSRAYLTGLTEVNRANQLLAFTTQISDSLSSASEALERTKGLPGSPDLATAFALNQERAIATAAEGARLAPARSRIQGLFLLLADSLQRFRMSGSSVFSGTGNATQNVLIASQFELEVKEALRVVQIAVHSEDEESFRRVYAERFRPLAVAGAIALGLCVLVWLISATLMRRLADSIEQLMRATDAVAAGDFEYQATIHRADELGRLTYEFNEMVRKAQQAFRRTASLQNITAAFSESLSPAQVSNVIMIQGVPAMGAAGAVIYLVNEAGDRLELQSFEGYSEAFMSRWRSLPLEGSFPITDAVRKRGPVWIESRAQLLASYRETYADLPEAPLAFVALPLLAHGKPIGGLGINFPNETAFTPDDRAFMIALASQAAQALQRSKLYDRAEESVRARDEFLSIASHELKTPITSMKMQLQMTERTLNPEKGLFPPPERLRKFLDSFSLQIGRLIGLVEDLLDVSKLHAGKLALNFETVNLSELATEVLERFSPEFAERRIDVGTEIESEVRAWCDRFRMDQVFVNLISNAVKYGEGKPLKIRLGTCSEHVRFAVQDFGIGVPAEKQAAIFERFERADPSRNIGGLGLGLYIAKQIVENQHGTIRVESRVGAGSTFTVDLPRAAPS